MAEAGPFEDSLRLERLWAGEFGDRYVERNVGGGMDRAGFWAGHFERFPSGTVLEVGCNMGANLRHICEVVPPRQVWGVDVNEEALKRLRSSLPSVNSGWAQARRLPFRDSCFDSVFSVAVLIHVPEESLADVVAEMVRCSRRFVCCIEYTAPTTTTVVYRGETSAFFKRDYAAVIGELHPELLLRREGQLSRADDFDDGLGYFVFEKPEPPTA